MPLTTDALTGFQKARLVPNAAGSHHATASLASSPRGVLFTTSSRTERLQYGHLRTGTSVQGAPEHHGFRPGR